MLLRTLFVLLLFTTMAEAMVHSIHAFAQTLLHRQAVVAVHQEIAVAVTSAEQAVANAVQVGGDPRALEPIAPSPSPTCMVATQRGCAISGVATIAFETIATATPTPCPDNDCTAYVQSNDAVDEGRIAVTVTANATSADGAILASRITHAVFRTMRTPPYVALAGSADDSLAPLGAGGAGDDAGAAPSGTAPGTLIDVLYKNQATGATMPANVWRPQAQRSGATVLPWAP